MEKNTNITKNKTIYKDYWQKRAEKTFLTGEKEALQVAKELKTNYSKAIREIEGKINQFYGKYASETGMTLEEAKRYLDKNQLKDFKAYIKEMLSMGKKENFTDEQLNEFKRLYNKAKITRLQELEANIQYEVDKLTNINKDKIQELLEDTYEEGYYNTIFNVEQFKGFSDSFSALNSQAIYRAINTKYLGENYSSRIWQNESNLMNTLEQEIPRGLTLGYNPRKLADMTSKKLGTNYNNTVRLIRTEYSKILNDSTLAGYRACGIDSYQILATLDMKTCDDCGEFDSKIVPIASGETGVNLPPFHPNCRCTTIPYFEPDEFDDLSVVSGGKVAYRVPTNITYKQWKEGLVELPDNKMQYKNNLEIPGINTNANLLLDGTNSSKKEISFIKKYLPKGSNDIAVNLNLNAAMTYSQDKDKIFFNPYHKDWDKYKNKGNMLIHEICHMLDIRNGITDKLSLSSDIMTARNAILDNKDYYEKLINNNKYMNNMPLGDIFTAITKGKVYNTFGHAVNYWTIDKDTGILLNANQYLFKAKAELFANISQLYINGDKDTLDLIRNIPGMKDMTNEFIKIIKKYI